MLANDWLQVINNTSNNSQEADISTPIAEKVNVIFFALKYFF
jgi:hypothetical protein